VFKTHCLNQQGSAFGKVYLLMPGERPPGKTPFRVFVTYSVSLITNIAIKWPELLRDKTSQRPSRLPCLKPRVWPVSGFADGGLLYRCATDHLALHLNFLGYFVPGLAAGGIK